MSVSILIISHPEIGHALVKTAKTTFGKENLPLPTRIYDVLPETDCSKCTAELKELLTEELKNHEGVLILTDIFGATPNNLAQIVKNEKIRIVTGLNLPMLLRVMNYHTAPLDKLAETARQGGQAGIIECEVHK
jgi:PTS system mannose-specific IIA component